MANINKIIIGIQARSGSKRFPRKVFHKIDGKPVLQHVIDACNKCTKYMNRYSLKTSIYVETFVLCPYGDEIVQAFRRKTTIIEGPEDDVLARYKILSDKFKPDYIVRITSDCVLLPPFLITKHIKTAVMNKYDYVSNVDPKYRTSPDGFDCEVISRQLLEWLTAQQLTASEKEHVTIKARQDPPEWANIGTILGFLDESSINISLDTPEDLKEIEKRYFNLKQKMRDALDHYGEGHVHRT